MNPEIIKDLFLEFDLYSAEECTKILVFRKNLVDTNYTIKLEDKFYDKGCSMKSQDLEYNKETKWIFDKLKDYISSSLNVEWLENPHAVFRQYSSGDYFYEHKDNVDKTGADPRYFTVTVQLNNSDEYIGGDVIVDRKNIVDRKIGSAAIWGSNIIHEVKNIDFGIRNSLIFFVSSKHINFNKKSVI